MVTKLHMVNNFLQWLYIYGSLPRKDPSDVSTIVDCSEFQRIEEAARIITAEERAAAAEKVRRQKEQEMVGVKLFGTSGFVLAIKYR